jgi:sortase A
MSQTLVADRSSTSDPARGGARPPKRKLRTPILLQVAAMIGIGALLYPSAADWFSTIGHNAEVSGYVREVEQLPDEVRIEKLQIAKEYNAHMPTSVLRDPYGADGDADLREDAAYQAYTQVLRVSDNGVIGEILYPRLNIGLPIYHGTGESSISKGAGHLYGSSLPVGGPSTHSVLTSHSGLVNASLFTPLTKAEIGDTFQVTVLGETHYYQVDGIETIEPFVTDSLSIRPGEDRVTLITCTPIGINSHRLLVHAIRIAAPEGAGESVITGDGRTTGFPWWAIGFLGASALTAYLLFVPPRRKRAEAVAGSREKAGAQTAGRHRATADEHPDLTDNDQERRA